MLDRDPGRFMRLLNRTLEDRVSLAFHSNIASGLPCDAWRT
jgi:hypothetical protein